MNFADLSGIITLKPDAYRRVAHDPSALTPALIIVVVVTIISAALTALLAANTVIAVVSALTGVLFGWLLASVLLALVARTLFQGDTNVGEMLRMLGFVYVFNILGIIPIVGGIAALVLSAIGTVIGIREAANLDTQKSVITAVITWVIVFIVNSIIVGAITAAAVLSNM